MFHRISLLVAVVIAALAISVTPALAGEDDGNPATPPAAPAPAPPPAPAPTPVVEVPESVQREIDRLQNQVEELQREAGEESGSGGGGGGGNSGASNSSSSPAPSFTPVAQVATVPQGGVQAGAGGTAPQDGSIILPIGLGLIGLMLVAGGFALRRRYVTE